MAGPPAGPMPKARRMSVSQFTTAPSAHQGPPLVHVVHWYTGACSGDFVRVFVLNYAVD